MAVEKNLALNDIVMKATVDNLLNTITQTVVNKINPDKIYLFGSQAKGTADRSSDIDLLIIADLPGNKHQRSLKIRKLFPDRDFSLDVMVYNLEEYEEESQIINTIGYTVAHEGKLLYAK